MPIPTYLSIDLDYWRDSKPAIAFIYKAAVERNLPTLVALEHDNLLYHVNRSGCRRLVHIDQHDDLASLEDHASVLPELSDATWVTHVSWAHEGTFVWIRPPNQNGLWGVCDDKAHLWEPGTSATSGWKRLRQTNKLRVPWKEVTHVGIALSPDYWEGGGQSYWEVVEWLLGWAWVRGETLKAYTLQDKDKSRMLLDYILHH